MEGAKAESSKASSQERLLRQQYRKAKARAAAALSAAKELKKDRHLAKVQLHNSQHKDRMLIYKIRMMLCDLQRNSSRCSGVKAPTRMLHLVKFTDMRGGWASAMKP